MRSVYPIDGERRYFDAAPMATISRDPLASATQRSESRGTT